MGQSAPSIFQLAQDGKVEEMRALLAQDAQAAHQCDPTNEYKYTALHWAARQGHVGAVSLLLEAGAQIEARNSYGYSPLHWAAKENRIDVARLLIDAGANVNAQDDMGDTPLHLAARSGHLAVVQLLVEHAPALDVWITERWGNTAAQVASTAAVARYLVAVQQQTAETPATTDSSQPIAIDIEPTPNREDIE